MHITLHLHPPLVHLQPGKCLYPKLCTLSYQRCVINVLVHYTIDAVSDASYPHVSLMLTTAYNRMKQLQVIKLT